MPTSRYLASSQILFSICLVSLELDMLLMLTVLLTCVWWQPGTAVCIQVNIFGWTLFAVHRAHVCAKRPQLHRWTVQRKLPLRLIWHSISSHLSKASAHTSAHTRTAHTPAHKDSSATQPPALIGQKLVAPKNVLFRFGAVVFWGRKVFQTLFSESYLLLIC